MDPLLKDKKGIIFGVADKKSIAWAIAQSLMAHGAETILTYQSERLEKHIKPLLEDQTQVQAMVCDVLQTEQVEAVLREAEKRWGKLDFLIHSIAYAHWDDLRDEYFKVSMDGFQTALSISAYTLTALARQAKPLLEKAQGASIVTLTYLGSDRVLPGYNVMGVAKAALESSVRYLAYDLGPLNIRVNAISAGPLATRAAKAIQGFSDAQRISAERSPLKRNIDASEVGDAAVFLCSRLSRGITGDVLFVDSGYHVLG